MKKRKIDDIGNESMKLRSGKTLISKTRSPLPEELNDKLETSLQNFKTLFAGNPQHAKELLEIISEAKSIEIRFNIRNKIEEVYDINNVEKISPLMGAAGDLAWLLVGNNHFYKEHHIEPEYHNIIENRIKNFDLEADLIGNIEE